MTQTDAMTAMMAMGAGIFMVIIVIGIVFYILKSIALTTMAANRGIENPWLGWIPVGDLYIAGTLLGEMELFGYRLTNLGLWVPVAYVGGTILGMIPVIGALFSIALLVFAVIFTYNLFKIYSTQAVLFTVLSILLCLWPVFLFVVRNNQPIGQPVNIQPPSSEQ
ncbi:hypothetical protein [Syntrophomonas palmitatica]|uniref:hypothetical protein n=1 Tax=Syntrophomonas palmitatica TaxID=402877 RepID=UPI0006CFAAF3|nr:hypothetical protein [Syntrophomonas palmitatica]